MSDSKYGHLRRQSMADSHPINNSSSQVKRSTTVHGTPSASLKKKTDMKNNSRDDIVNMRLEIMQSLRRSPTKLFDDNTNRLPPIKQSENTLKFNSHKLEPPLPNSVNSSEHLSYSSETKTRLSEDLQEGLSNQADFVEGYIEDVDIEDFDMEDEVECKKSENSLFQDTTNTLDTASTLPPPNSINSVKSQVSKRVFSRQSNPEKLQSNLPTKVQPAQHPRKKTRNSPPVAQSVLNQNIPTGLPQRSVSTTSASSYGLDKSKTTSRPTLLSSEIAKMNINKKSIPRAVSSTGHRLASSGRLQQFDKHINTIENEEVVTLKPTIPKRHQNLEELIPRNEYSIIRKNLKSKNSNASLHRSTSTTFKQPPPQEEENEVEEIEVRVNKDKFERKEINVVDSPTLLESSNEKVDAVEISKLKAQHATDMASLQAQLAGKDTELARMKEFMLASEQKALDSERHLVESLEKVAKELHSQYSLKHETKVQALKKQHSNNLEQKLQELRDQIKDLEAVVERERLEKDELVKTCDMYLEIEEQRMREEEERKKGLSPNIILKSSLLSRGRR